MAGIIAKSVWKTAKFGVKYVVVPIAYTAFLGYLMQEAAEKIREGGEHREHEAAHYDPELRPSP